MRGTDESAGPAQTGYRGLLRNHEFSGLFVADVASRIGGQLGKFALAALVYERTRSAALAAVAFAVTYLPGLLGGPVLSTLADRLPRRGLLITCDVVRAVVTGLIAFLGDNIPLALALLLLAEFFRVPFGAARTAILADVLPTERFAAGNALVATSQQAVQVIGFAAGGFVVVLIGSPAALGVNALAYAVSAVLLAVFVVPRPAPARPAGTRQPILRDTWQGLRVVRDTARMPSLFCLLFLGPTVLATAEGLALPLAAELRLGEQGAGILLAAPPLGSAVGLLVVGRMSTPTRERLVAPGAVAVGLCIAAAGLAGPAVLVVAALLLAGLAMGHVAQLQAAIVGLVPAGARGRVVGLANTALQLGQALALLLAGVIAQATSSRGVLVGAGVAAGVAAAAVVGRDPAARQEGRPTPEPVNDLAIAGPGAPRVPGPAGALPAEVRPAGALPAEVRPAEVGMAGREAERRPAG
ncbi:Predicted arabinose efflux permease, MFS family [Actinopolymorpha cephalotaxi]|uniref:MFS family permease n=1 Tax=Actinopolymorpha cephalotaxi TaxID=504797 RepID=A0A1I2WAL1_9ACTN|nr:MFS transporter [Actinopolymorpha cephalotaxi]NYH82668.1 MFS family permease [Actinopolymorpha cephalotaxi]SFG98423.1 Predicted arabinose efflux permease, MFS family [Actinopolymorpha cephalotaxi]